MADNDATNPLRPQQLLRTMLAVLPPSTVGPGRRDGDDGIDEADSASGRSSSMADTVSLTSTAVADVAELATACEALALLAHACMVQLGFRLTGLREDDAPLPTAFTGEDAATAPSSGAADQQAVPAAAAASGASGAAGPGAPAPSRLPYHWNATPSSLSFVYSHAQSALRFVVRVDRMGATAEIRGLSLAGGSGNGSSSGSSSGERIVRIAFPVADYVATALLPWRCAADDEDAGGASLRPVFVDDAHLARLAQRFQVEIAQPLLPNLQLPGYREDAGSRGGSNSRPQEPLRQPRQPPPRLPYNPYQPGLEDDPLAAGRRPRGDFPPPGFDDEYDLNRPMRGFYGSGGGGLGGLGGGGFGSIGGDDLHPPGLGPHDPLRPSFAGGGGGGLGGLGGFGGMHPTFDDPLFQGPRGGARGGIRGPGTNGMDPQVPPGARYDDPTGPNGDELGGGGPWGPPRGGGGGFGFGGGRGFGNGNGGFGGFGGGGIS